MVLLESATRCIFHFEILDIKSLSKETGSTPQGTIFTVVPTSALAVVFLLEESKYRTVNVISYRMLQSLYPVGNYCAFIFRFAQFFVGKGGFALSQLESDSYYFVFINLMLGSLKSKLV